ncbi:uncharacterized protein AB675_8222 [Cyphellophora attinorum]|uniref:Uncharacterized protein n=1 Tax=Cyphellophora attinorum TaxID=1664694 RepID=A0A0N1HAW8_9EURO|nr:uncharacterized protein AB675_8222 [Phialophora attinorum]KPI41263.1 hypothetical protein AB675_8222 [Phialophora attinorum]
MAVNSTATISAGQPVVSVFKPYAFMPVYHFASALGADEVATTMMIDCENSCNYWADAIVLQGPSTFAAALVPDDRKVVWDCSLTAGAGADCAIQEFPAGYEIEQFETGFTLPAPFTAHFDSQLLFPVTITAGELTPFTQATSLNITVTGINTPRVTAPSVDAPSITSIGTVDHSTTASSSHSIPTQSSSANSTTHVAPKDTSSADRMILSSFAGVASVLLVLTAIL